MSKQKFNKERDLKLLRKECVDLATRVINEPVRSGSKKSSEVVRVAREMYDFIKNG